MKWPPKTTMRDDQVDDTKVEETGHTDDLTPTLVDEEGFNPDPNTGYNRTNSRTGKGGASDRFKK